MNVLHVAATSIMFCLTLSASGQSEVVCGQSLDVPLKSEATLAIESRPAGLELVGTDQDTMHVSCHADDGEVAQHIHIHFSGTASDGKLTIDGSHVRHGNLQVRIEVPRKLSLGIRMPAGEVKVENIAGNKDIAVYAGRISISADQAWNYRTLDASVVIGAVNAPAYGIQKGGFFRSLKREAADGQYHLRADVMTGEIALSGRAIRATTD